ncbi:MAG: MFS transporter, partial [Roseburia sp.]|nr:MFS transporter [Roseburia sp.]
GADLLTAVLYLAMGWYVGRHEFSYGLYLVFVLVIGTISVCYRLAYNAWYPELIPVGLEQKGYSVSNTIYPIVTIAMSPIAAFLYEKISMGEIFFLVAAITFAAVLVESGIAEKRKEQKESYTFRSYWADMREGFAYLKKEKGIRNIYAYMSITQGTTDGTTILTQAFYQTMPYLTVTMLGFLKSAEMVGRFLGGLFQYRKEIPVNKRYGFTKMVYTAYNLLDIVLLFLPYPLMLLNRFICGVLGISSATIRETAVQCYLPEHMRARVNAFFNMVMSFGCVVFQLVAGSMGQWMSYRTGVVLISAFGMLCMVVLIVLPAKENRPIYEAVRNQ